MPSARRKRSQNIKYYIQNVKELKAKAKANYSANPEKKNAVSKVASSPGHSPPKSGLVLTVCACA